MNQFVYPFAVNEIRVSSVGDLNNAWEQSNMESEAA